MTDRAPGRCGGADVRILYISYDGVLEPLGESQVVSYLERCSDGRSLTLLTFEKPIDRADRTRVAAMADRLRAANVEWIPRRYHHRPYLPAKAFDVLSAWVVGRRWARGGGRLLIHARGYLPSLMALVIRMWTDARFIFDMRGFWADERVEAGFWRRGSGIDRTVKWLERRFFERADAIVSLTHDGVRAFDALGYRIRRSTPIVVIPTCTNLDRFYPGAPDPAAREALGLKGRLVFGAVGTMSGWYLRREMLQYLALLVKKFDGACALVITREDHARLRADAAGVGLTGDALRLVRAEFEAMPRFLRLLDLGVLFLRDSFAKRASAATTLGELLASGVPVVLNRGGGDASALVEQGGAGLVLRDTRESTFEGSIDDVRALVGDPGVRRRCREVAERHFDLRAGVRQYTELYDQLVSRAS